jgi:protein-L-isoaspartate(D-aspartate) O-methyltransferase
MDEGPARTSEARARMVADQLLARNVRDERVLAAMGAVRRELFVPEHDRSSAYADNPLPIGGGQTISQPYIVARMTELLVAADADRMAGLDALAGRDRSSDEDRVTGGDRVTGEDRVTGSDRVSDRDRVTGRDPLSDVDRVTDVDRVLEIGTGSGYQAAVLAELGCHVTSIERDPDLAASAQARLTELGYGDHVEIRIGDGSLGAPDGAPWDGILVAAAAPGIPMTLREQLGDGRRLVIPVGSRHEQLLMVVERRGREWIERSDGRCVFVPLVGEGGW